MMQHAYTCAVYLQVSPRLRMYVCSMHDVTPDEHAAIHAAFEKLREAYCILSYGNYTPSGPQRTPAYRVYPDNRLIDFHYRFHRTAPGQPRYPKAKFYIYVPMLADITEWHAIMDNGPRGDFGRECLKIETIEHAYVPPISMPMPVPEPARMVAKGSPEIMHQPQRDAYFCSRCNNIVPADRESECVKR